MKGRGTQRKYDQMPFCSREMEVKKKVISVNHKFINKSRADITIILALLKYKRKHNKIWQQQYENQSKSKTEQLCQNKT